MKMRRLNILKAIIAFAVPVLAFAPVRAADDSTNKNVNAARKPDYTDEHAAKIEPARKVVYKTIAGSELHLDIFEPTGLKAGDKRACFFSIHGGGWTGLTPRRQYPTVAHFASLGMVGISVEYRLAKAGHGETVFDCVKDARSAMRYTRAHAAELGIDPDKIIANGGSAGGHLAAGLALFDGIDESGDDTSVSCVPNALVLFFPVIDTSSEGYGNRLLGSRWQEISPLHRVKAGTPPTIIFHGTGDTTTPFKGAAAFRDAMIKAGNRCELIAADGATHGYLMRDQTLFAQTLQTTDKFLSSLGFLNEAGK